MTVQQLRNDGYKVSVSHYRLTPVEPWITEELTVSTSAPMHQRQIREEGREFLARGGLTFVVITDLDGTRATSYAACSNLDNYCKRTGRQIAIGRALKKLREGGDTI